MKHQTPASNAHRPGLGRRSALPVQEVRNRGGSVDALHAARRERLGSAWLWKPPRKDASGSTPDRSPLVAQRKISLEKDLSQVRFLSICSGRKAGAFREEAVETPSAERGARDHRLRCNPKPTPRQPVAVCARPGHSPRPQPARCRPTRGSTTGALQGPRLCPLEPRHRCNGTPIAKARTTKRSEKRKRR